MNSSNKTKRGIKHFYKSVPNVYILRIWIGLISVNLQFILNAKKYEWKNFWFIVKKNCRT